MKRTFYTIMSSALFLGMQYASAAVENPQHLLERAQQGDQDAIAELFYGYVNEQRRRDWSQLHWVAYQGDQETAMLFLDDAGAIDMQDQFGWTPLHIASGEGRADMVQFFVDNGAAVGLTDDTGHTAFSLAVNAGHEQVARILFDAGGADDVDAAMFNEDALLVITRLMNDYPVNEQVQQSINDEQKRFVHHGLTDAEVITLIEGQGSVDPISLEALDVNQLEQVIVVSSGQAAIHVSTVQGMIRSGRTVRDPFTRDQLPRELIDYVVDNFGLGEPEGPVQQSLNDEHKRFVHHGLTDAQVVALIDGQDGVDPISYDDLDINQLEQVIVLSNGRIAVHLDTMRRIIANVAQDPFTREPFTIRID